MNVDLHMHTLCSDGTYTPEQLTAAAAAAQLGEIAITDHDTVDAYSSRHTFSPDIRVIPGIEISSEYQGRDVHILGYYINTKDPSLAAYCRQFYTRRLQRAREMVDKIAALGYAIDMGKVNDLIQKKGTIGRPHIAALLVAGGYFPDVQTAFDSLLYRDGPAYVPYQRYTIDESIQLIRTAGGVAVLAHPSLIRKHLDEVLQHDFDGIEVYHPQNKGRYEEFLQIANDKNWMVSGGSDFHGIPGRFPETVGVFSVDAGKLSKLLTYRRSR